MTNLDNFAAQSGQIEASDNAPGADAAAPPTPSFRLARFPAVTLILLAVMVALFVAELAYGIDKNGSASLPF